jgi:hypothetical protein
LKINPQNLFDRPYLPDICPTGYLGQAPADTVSNREKPGNREEELGMALELL